MKSTDDRPRPPAAAAPGDSFESLRAAFYARLSSYRERITELSAELARAEAHATPVYTDIHMVAHRLSGAAAVFEAHEISRAANTLDEAARAALKGHADDGDAMVRSALDALVDLLSMRHAGDVPNCQDAISS